MCRSVEKELRLFLDVAKSIVGFLLFFGMGILVSFPSFELCY